MNEAYEYYYDAIEAFNQAKREREASWNRFNNADPYDHNEIDSAIFKLKSDDLLAESRRVKLGNVRVFPQEKLTLIERIRRYFSDGRATT